MTDGQGRVLAMPLMLDVQQATRMIVPLSTWDELRFAINPEWSKANEVVQAGARAAWFAYLRGRGGHL